VCSQVLGFINKPVILKYYLVVLLILGLTFGGCCWGILERLKHIGLNDRFEDILIMLQAGLNTGTKVYA